MAGEVGTLAGAAGAAAWAQLRQDVRVAAAAAALGASGLCLIALHERARRQVLPPRAMWRILAIICS